MKNKYLGIVAAMLLMAGCSNDDFIKEAAQQDMKSFSTFMATTGEMADTRAYVVNDNSSLNKMIAWQDYDEIRVMSDTEREFELYNLIEIKSNNVGVFGGNELSGNKFYAFYPGWDWSTDEDPNIVHFAFQGETAINDNDFHFSTPMVAVSEDNNFTFKQTTGMIHIRVTGIYDLETVRLEGNDSEILSGTGYIDLSEANPIFRIDSNPSWSHRSLYGYSRENIDEEVTDLYFSVPVMTFEKGISVYINGYDENGQFIELTKSTTSPLQVERAQVRNFKLIDVNAELEAIEEAKRQEEARTREVLSLFYEALDGDNWNNNTNWTTEAPLNEWDGLEVDQDGHLTGISLNWNNLSGVVPAEIGELTHLTLLNLAGNRLTSIPETIGTLQNLQVLHIGSNKLSKFPEAITQLVNLQELYIHGNQISSIPVSIVALQNLQVLDIAGNQWSEFPEVVTQLDHLQLLDLNSSHISSLPASLANMKGLTTLYLNYNELTGEIPEVLAELPNLTSLDLSNNELTGNLPTWISQLTNLEILAISDNELTGGIPAEWFSSLSKIHTLNLQWNKLSGTITKEMQEGPLWKAPFKHFEQQEGYGLEIEGAVKEIELNTYSLVLVPGQTTQLIATVLPVDAFNKNVEWEVSWIDDYENPAFTLDENGLVTALCEGEGTIRVIALDNNGAVAYCKIKVVQSLAESEAEDFSGSNHDWDN